MYDEMIVAPMRQELTRLGIQETRTAAEVDAVLGEKKGTVLVVVNSVCGCAAGMARPAVAMALEHDTLPDKMITVFAGNDRDATAARPRVLRRLPPVVAVDRADQGRPGGEDARALATSKAATRTTSPRS